MAWKTTVPLVYLGKSVALPWFQLLVGHWAYPSEKYESMGRWLYHIHMATSHSKDLQGEQIGTNLGMGHTPGT
jgi:hypothetical protein